MENSRKKLLKIIPFAVICVAVIFCVIGCGSDSSWYMDPQEMANNIINEVDFDADMLQVRSEAVNTFIDMPAMEKGYMFMGDGSHSDGFGVFVFADEKDAKDAEKAIKKYLGEVEDSFKAYIPEEADKVSSHSLIIRKGANVVYVVCPDETKAEEVINKGFHEGEAPEDPGKSEEPQEEPADEGEDSGDEADQEADEPEDTADETGEEPEETKAEVDDDDTEINLKAYPSIKTKGKLKYVGFIGVIGKAAYEIFDYVDGVAENYADCVNYAAKKLDPDTKVYDMVIPLSSGVTVPNKYFNKIHGSNQKASMKYIGDKMNKKVTYINMFSNLMKHRDEDIYFRTDHHWTSLGAYYGYESWCDVKGVLPISLDRREKKNFGDFVGSFYYDTKVSALNNNPDTLEAYMPIGDVYIPKKDANGNKVKGDVIIDMTNAASYAKYDAFLGGDQGLVTIKNKSVTDGSVLVVVKESFGNCIVPYLADHYSKVYVIDYRYFSKNIIDFCKSKKANDLIFINNIGMTRSSYLVGKLSEAVKQ